MLRLAATFTASLAFVVLGACGDDNDSTTNTNPGPQLGTIVEVAQQAGTFSTLLSALGQTGLDTTLSGEGPFIVFAPTDAAFDRLPDGVLASLDAPTLTSILTYHVVGGAAVGSNDVVNLESATTVEGSEVNISVMGSSVVLDGVVQVTSTDIEASNGIIHVIDAVLLPKANPFPGDIVDAVSAYPIFDTLVGAVAQADLVSALQSDNNGDGFTAFAPTASAFMNLGVDLSTLTSEQLTDILLYHVVGDTVDSNTVVTLSSAPTLEGSNVSITTDSNGVLLDGNSRVTRVDIVTSNGIIHVIDAVLTP